MYTIIETPTYSSKVGKILTEDERETLAVYLSINPRAGSIVRGTGGVRKLRWALRGRGKSGGARITYFNRLAYGQVWLLTIYAKGGRKNIPAWELKLIKEAIDRD